jgi:hypothetical protein
MTLSTDVIFVRSASGPVKVTTTHGYIDTKQELEAFVHAAQPGQELYDEDVDDGPRAYVFITADPTRPQPHRGFDYTVQVGLGTWVRWVNREPATEADLAAQQTTG